MKPIADRLSGYTPPKPQTRGDLLKIFAEKTGYPIGFVAKQFKGMHDLQTLRYVLSRCKSEVEEGRKKGWKHAFDYEMKIIWKNANGLPTRT